MGATATLPASGTCGAAEGCIDGLDVGRGRQKTSSPRRAAPGHPHGQNWPEPAGEHPLSKKLRARDRRAHPVRNRAGIVEPQVDRLVTMSGKAVDAPDEEDAENKAPITIHQ